MAIVLCRVDDRLVHGQVVIGWGRPLGIDLIMLVDDTVAASAWEQELYRMAVSPEIEVRFVTVAEAAALGVRRISVGGTLARTAWAGFLRAAQEIADEGTFSRFEGLPDVDAQFSTR